MVVLLGVLATLLVVSSVRESQTVDEGAHLASGYSYWKTGDFRLNPEHPPLIKLLASVPLLALNLHQPASIGAWKDANQWEFSRQLLYDAPVSPMTVFLLGRLPIILLTLCLAVLVFVWSRRVWGFWGGVFSLALFSLDPNILAHGHYVTTDMGVTLFFVLSCYCFERLFDGGGKPFLFFFAFSVALAHVAKFSAVLIWPVLFFLYLHRRATNPESLRRVHLVKLILLTLSACIAVVILVYGFRPLPFLDGFFDVYWHNYWGHDAYLFGKTSSLGWWWYFPAAFLLKTPLATFMLLVLSLVAFLRATGRTWFADARLRILLPAILYLGVSMTSKVNLGLRHILPIYPFLFVFAGILTRVRFRRRTTFFRGILVVFVALLAVSTLLSAPFFITYFSEIIGGAANGRNYLVDSNLDWGQGLKELGEETKKRGITSMAIVYFGQTPLEAFLPGVTFRAVPRTDELQRQVDYRGWIAISVSVLVTDPRYSWLRDMEPTVRVGNSIFLYDR